MAAELSGWASASPSVMVRIGGIGTGDTSFLKKDFESIILSSGIYDLTKICSSRTLPAKFTYPFNLRVTGAFAFDGNIRWT